ncbi:putative G-protein coupled receptor 139 [Cetorhinus maximus]
MGSIWMEFMYYDWCIRVRKVIDSLTNINSVNVQSELFVTKLVKHPSAERETELMSQACELSSELGKVRDEISAQQGVGGTRANVRHGDILISNFQHIDGLFLTVNAVAIVILSRGKCGLSTCTTRYLVAMASADLLVIITEIILRRFRYYYYRTSGYYLLMHVLDITPVCSVIYVLHRAAIDCSVWFTVNFSFDRFVAICCQKLKIKYCNKQTSAMVLATTSILLFLKNVPFYFRFEPKMIINNVPWYCSNKPRYFTDFGWIGFKMIDKVLTPLIPFTLILLLNALTVRHILKANRVRKGLRSQSKGEKQRDPEMESRRKSVILLFTISGSFILLWFVNVLYFFNIAHHFNYDSFYIFEQFGFMLRNLNCCTNTIIYVVTQSKFRGEFKSAVKYPVASIIQCINNQKAERSSKSSR